jgi:hypothetical protein
VQERTVERIQQNNEVFKSANERIREAAEEYDHRLQRIPFICECPVEVCVEIVRLTEDEYSSIRANPDHFVTAVGHEAAEAGVARVVAQYDGYVVVEKQ